MILGATLPCSAPSRARVPPPTISRKIRPSSMLTSVRASFSVPQNPFFMNVTIVVEYKAGKCWSLKIA